MPVLPAQPSITPPLLYFAYGSNMDPVQIRRRCPSVRFVAIARLADHQLAFSRRSMRRRSGVADVVPAPGEAVWGIVYRLLSARDIEVLDAAEGFRPTRRRAQGYIREVRLVTLGDGAKPTPVNIYIAQRHKSPPLPTAAYIAHMTRGAEHWGLPEGYYAMLEAIDPKG
jgi:hypothetical protein